MKFSIPFGICAICQSLGVLEKKRVQIAKGSYKKYKTYMVCSKCINK